MSLSATSYIVIITILVFFSGLFSGLETAIASCDEIKFKTKAQNKKNKLYTLTLGFLENIDDTISRILVLNNIVNSIYATIITIIITKTFGIKYLTLAIVISTFFLFIFGEMFPKLLASIFRDKILIILLLLSYPFLIIIKPISNFFYKFSNSLAGLLFRKKNQDAVFSEDDVKSMVKNATSDGNLETDTKELIERAFEFDDKIIYSIMEKWEKVEKLEYEQEADKVYEKLKNQEFTRLPVVKDDGEVIGIYNIKKFLQAYYVNGKNLNLEQVLFPPFFLEWNSKIDDSLKILSENKVHMAFVKKDDKICGIVTIEDILEELVGEIEDEEDDI